MNRIIVRVFTSLMFKTQFAIRIRNLELAFKLMSNYAISATKVENLFEKLFEVLQIKHPLNQKIIRIGSQNDGGYLLIDDFNSNQIVISLGVGQNIDAEFELAELGLNIWMFDGTISRLPRRHNKFKFHPLNVCGIIDVTKSHQGLTTLNQIFDQVIMIQKPETFIFNGLCKNPLLILLIDIEGSEYEALLQLNEMQLSYCKQITVEFHNVFSELSSAKSRIIECINKLNMTHEIISVHGNNYGGSIQVNDMDFPDVIEISWASKTSYEFVSKKNTFNHPLSSPNNCKLRDLNHLW